jgi:hypothetical protein
LDEPGPYDKPKRKSTFNPELADALNPNKAALVEKQVGQAKDGLKKVNSPETKKEIGLYFVSFCKPMRKSVIYLNLAKLIGHFTTRVILKPPLNS